MNSELLIIILSAVCLSLLIAFVFSVRRINKLSVIDNDAIQSEKDEQEKLFQNSLDFLKKDNENFKSKINELQSTISSYESQLRIYDYNRQIKENFVRSNLELSQFIYIYINKISVFHPVYRKILQFNVEFNEIDEKFDKKEVVSYLQRAIKSIDFSNKSEVYEYWLEIADVLGNITKEKNSTTGNIFRSLLENIYESQKNYINSIIECYTIIENNFEHFEKIITRGFFNNILRGTWKFLGNVFLSVFIDMTTNSQMGDVMVQWKNSNELSDDDFVKLYLETLKEFVNEAQTLILLIDDKLSIIYLKFLAIKSKQDLKILDMIDECSNNQEKGDEIFAEWENKIKNLSINETIKKEIQNIIDKVVYD